MIDIKVHCPKCNSVILLEGCISQVWRCSRCEQLFGIQTVPYGEYQSETDHPFPLGSGGKDEPEPAGV